MHRLAEDLRSCRYLRLQTKLSIAISSLVIITAGLLTFALFMTARHQLREDIRCHLRNVAGIAALQIDSAAHATLHDRSQESGYEYVHIKWTLQKIRSKIPDIRYIYTWRFNDAGELIFVMDAETDPQKISHIGDVYHDDNGPELKSKLMGIKGPLADENFTKDQWGVWLSGYAPFYGQNGRLEGILGIDMAATDVISHEGKFLAMALLAFVCTVPLALITGWLLGRKLITPIEKLTVASEHIASGDLNYRVTECCSKEVQMLSSTFNRMAQKIQEESEAREQEITERTLTENKLAELNRELEATVNKLSLANRDLSDLTYVAAHDLKTPLRAIGSLASMMAKDYADKLDTEAKKLFGLLTGRSERMNDLLNALIEYTQIERIACEDEQVDINEVVKKTIKEVAAPANIEIAIANELPVITCGKFHAVRIFRILIANAVRFMDKPKGQISIACVDQGDFWRFIIKDNGPGIEHKYFAKIFKPFQTLHLKDEIETTGVGLALVKKIIDMYDGAIWLESEPGVGSTFSFALPKQRTANNMRLHALAFEADNG
jgi:signal transduction histidine kinase